MSEDIYREYVVRRAEVRTDPTDQRRTYFECDLEDRRREKVGFTLIISGCVGADDYTQQYELVVPHFKPGKLVQCAVAYLKRSNGFCMAMFDFMPMQAIKVHTAEPIDADTYFSKNRGFWATTLAAGKRVKLPGLIEFGGESVIPVVESRALPQVRYDYKGSEGLVWGRRPSMFGAIWKFLFGPKLKHV